MRIATKYEATTVRTTGALSVAESAVHRFAELCRTRAARGVEEVQHTVAKVVGQVLGVAGLLLCRLWSVGVGSRSRRMQVVESLALGGRRQLLLVRCDDQEYLVGTGPDSVETIVLRQPGGAGLAAAAPAGGLVGAQATPGAPRPRTGELHGGRPLHGPHLVTAARAGMAGGMAELRIRDTGSAPDGELWQ